MKIDRERFPHAIQGQLLRRSERREVAIFLHDRALWIADFIDGRGELVDALTWFRFNCGDVSSWHARRRMVLDSAIPLSEELVARIERLPIPVSDPKRGAIARLAEFLAAHLPPRRFATVVASRFHRRRRNSADSADRDASVGDVEG